MKRRSKGKQTRYRAVGWAWQWQNGSMSWMEIAGYREDVIYDSLATAKSIGGMECAKPGSGKWVRVYIKEPSK